MPGKDQGPEAHHHICVKPAGNRPSAMQSRTCALPAIARFVARVPESILRLRQPPGLHAAWPPPDVRRQLCALLALCDTLQVLFLRRPGSNPTHGESAPAASVPQDTPGQSPALAPPAAAPVSSAGTRAIRDGYTR